MFTSVLQSTYRLAAFTLVICTLGTNEVQGQTIDVALPDTFVTVTQSVMIPVLVSDLSPHGIFSFDITISYDSSIIEIEDVVTENSIAAGFFFSTNFNLDGQIAIAAAGVDSLKGAGPLFYLQVSFLQDGSSEMNFDKASFAEEAFEVATRNGRLRNISLASISSQEETPEQLVLSDNYPNPFSTTSTILMDLPEAAQVSVKVYNMTGQLEGSYPPRPIAAGTNQLVTIEASSLPTGSYFYRVIAHSANAVRYGMGTMTIIH
jgi:hypothetical protein